MTKKYKLKRKTKKRTYRKYGGTIPRLDEPIYDLGKANSSSGSSPIYDLGQANSSSGSSPIYDLGQADPIYDLGQAEPDLNEARLQIPNIIDISMYNSDSGTRDLSTEKRYNKNTPFIEILKKANELKAHLIVQTSYISAAKPGAWYIKGYKSEKNYDQIKTTIEENVRLNKYDKRKCYLIKYAQDESEIPSQNKVTRKKPCPRGMRRDKKTGECIKKQTQGSK